MYIIACLVIILINLSIRSIRNKKNKSFILLLLIPFPKVFLSLGRSKSLTYILFLLSKEFLYLLLASQVQLATNSLHFCHFISPFLKDNFLGYKILDWLGFSLNTLYVSVLLLPAWFLSKTERITETQTAQT